MMVHPPGLPPQLTIELEAPIFTVDTNPNLFEIMGDTNIFYNWFLGSANMLQVFKGFSLWLAFSAIALSVLSLLVVRDRGVLDSTRARVAKFNAVAFLIFAVLAWTSFINPPRFLALVGAAAFGLAARGFRLRDAPRSA